MQHANPLNFTIEPPTQLLFSITAFGRLELEAGAGMVWEKNTVGLAGAGAGGWSGVRGNYYSAGGWLELELVAGVVWEEIIIALEATRPVEHSGVYMLWAS